MSLCSSPGPSRPCGCRGHWTGGDAAANSAAAAALVAVCAAASAAAAAAAGAEAAGGGAQKLPAAPAPPSASPCCACWLRCLSWKVPAHVRAWTHQPGRPRMEELEGLALNLTLNITAAPDGCTVCPGGSLYWPQGKLERNLKV